jgi:site-specific DNA recombinase
MTPPTLRVALYARVSSEQQVIEETIESQLDLLMGRIRADGVEVAPELRFIDEGYSAETLLRPGLERLRDTAVTGAIDRLYIQDPDRLGRDYAYQMVLVDELQKCGIEIIFLNYKIDTTPEGRLLLQVQSMIAEYERTKIRERCRRGRLFAARAGKVSVLGGAPFGYRYIAKREGGGQARYVVEFTEAPIAREMFEWVAIEGCSLSQVCNRLKERGVLTRRGHATWDPATVSEMLSNPAYMGEARYGKVRIVPARPRLRPRRGVSEYPRRSSAKEPTAREAQIPIAVPALVTPELFAAVQERLAEHKQHPGQTVTKPRYLLAGLVVCKQCGYAYRGRSRGSKSQYTYYCCHGTEPSRSHGQKVCSSRSIRVDRLDEAVWSDVRKLLSEPERLAQEFERRLSGDGGKSETDPTSQSLAKQISQVKRRLARLVEMYAEGYLEKADFQKDMEGAQERLSELESEQQGMMESDQRRAELRLVIGQLEEFGQQVREGLEASDLATRRRIICALVKQIEIDSEQVNIVYKVGPSPFDPSPTGRNGPHCWGLAVAPSGLKAHIPDSLSHTRRLATAGTT